jgi:hypothetical protein
MREPHSPGAAVAVGPDLGVAGEGGGHAAVRGRPVPFIDRPIEPDQHQTVQLRQTRPVEERHAVRGLALDDAVRRGILAGPDPPAGRDAGRKGLNLTPIPPHVGPLTRIEDAPPAMDHEDIIAQLVPIVIAQSNRGER